MNKKPRSPAQVKLDNHICDLWLKVEKAIEATQYSTALIIFKEIVEYSQLSDKLPNN